MRITLVTTTCDRPFGIRLMEQYIAAQTVGYDQWIVADSGKVPAPLTMGQTHIHNPSPPGARNLADNVLAAMEVVDGDVVVFVEDDDYYHPDHVESCVRHLRGSPVAGCGKLNYYNVRHRCWIEMENKGSALCQTAFRSDMVPIMKHAAMQCRARNDFGIDGQFWRMTRGVTHGDMTVTGIKGVPGTVGLGNGHRPNSSSRRRWKPDPGFDKLREWIGNAAENYINADYP